MTTLGVCGAFTPDGRCQGSIIVQSEIGELIEGACERCGTTASIPILKANPAVRRQRRIEQADLPRRFFGARFEENADNRAALQSIREWINGYETGNLPAPALWGDAGRGKTHLLCGIGKRLIQERDQTVLYRNTRTLLRELQGFGEDAERLWNRATSVGVLILDDLGSERSTEWRHDQLSDLVDVRYDQERPIVLATNFPPAAWREAVDERTASRLAGMTFPVHLKGPDRRQPLAEGRKEAHA